MAEELVLKNYPTNAAMHKYGKKFPARLELGAIASLCTVLKQESLGQDN